MMWRIEVRTRDEEGGTQVSTEDLEGDVDAVNARLLALAADHPDAEFGAQELPDPNAPPPSTPVPDAPTNSDWRVALIQMGRFEEVADKIAAAKEGGTPQGLIAWTRFEYANNVYRSELLQLAPLFGFTEADVDESLTRAAAVAKAAQ